MRAAYSQFLAGNGLDRMLECVKHRAAQLDFTATRPVLIMRGLIQLQRDPLHDAVDLSARGPARD